MRRKAPLRPSFSDTAKQAAGVHVHDLAAELALARAELVQARESYAKQLAGMVELIGTAITAYDENRRGDCLTILRSLVRSKTPGKLSLPEPPRDPSAA